VAQAMRPRRGKANKEDQMSSQEPPEGERPEVIDIVFGLPRSPRGAYRRERDDGTIVHGDASGEWTMNEKGKVDDIVFFASPLWLRGRHEI
jgi:hypothetical protein